MIKALTLAAALSATLLYACRHEDESCVCEDYEECVDGACQIKPNHFRWGESGVSGSDLYHGVVEGNACIDTVVFNIEPEGGDFRFSLFTIGTPHLRQTGAFVAHQISDTEYILGSGDFLCPGLRWYASIHCELFVPDSVRLNFLFEEMGSTPFTYVDSVRVTLRK